MVIWLCMLPSILNAEAMKMTCSCIYKCIGKSDGKWSVIHGQRSTGRKPDEEPPKF